ncbi:TP901 family phage tail tape measure protein [Paenarthrobacter nicotinovorans]|uniref:phage tail tape measure protein n=1 Tax=Micrococcaceae TaxID=1268 RepID=UPI0015875D4F|nr:MULTISPECIES: phage tail tape measure protein [Micrococcaceae]MDR6439099.1 TP901 family phage tail tape measure protein [Paenarthrobacter nicotinovorans]
MVPIADRSISIALEAKVTDFVSGMKTAAKSAEDFASRTAKFARDNEQHFDRVGRASMVFGGALLAGFALAVKQFMEFDAAMSQVQASTHETAANMELLRNAAIDAGADTSFSAKEAAQAIDELAKAGVSTKDILNGGLKGAMSLAAAGSLEVADAAEIAATALTQFKLSGQDIPHLADLLAAGAGKAQGSVEDIGNALKQSGLVAAQFGLSVEDTTGTLAAFASAGLTGSDSGTSFKTMLLSLAKPAKETQSLMNELGISAYDAQGDFVGITNLAEQLKSKLGGLTQAQRDAALAQIFGTDAIRGANVLYEQGASGIQGWIDKVNEAGYAAVTASIKQDNLAGDLEKLGGSFDSVLIKGGSGAAQALRGIVQGAEDLIDAIGKIPTPILNAAVGIAGMAGGALLLGGALLTALPRLVEFHASLNRIAPAGSRARTSITNVGKAAGGAAALLIALQAASAVFSEKHTKSAEDYGQALLKVQDLARSGAASLSGLDSAFQDLDSLAGIAPGIDNAADAIKRLTNQNFTDVTLNKGLDGFREWVTGSKGDIGQLEDRMKGLGEQMGSLAKNGAADTAAKSFQALTAEFQKNGKSAKDALEYLPGYKDALLSLANQSGQTLTEQELLDFAMGKIPDSMKVAGDSVETYTTKVGNAAPLTEEMSSALEGVGLSAAGAITNIEAFTASLFAAGILSLSASDAAIAYQDAIDKLTESVTANGTTLDINTAAGRANQSAFNDVAQAAMTSAAATAEETLKTQGSAAAQQTLQAGLRTSYNDLIAAAGQFGITGDAADTMARKALGIPKNVNIDAWIADHATTTLDSIKGKAEGLDGRQVRIGIYTTEYFDSVDRRSTAPDLNGGASGTGRMGSYAAGGRVFGPGTTTSDSIDARLSKDEYVLTAKAAQKIGYDNLDRMNGGDVTPIRPMGYQYAPAAAPARSVVAAPAVASSPTQMTGTLILDSGQVFGTFRGVATEVASGVVKDADSNSPFIRRGR